MNTRELDWASGLFEGEGCITINKANKRRGAYARVSLNSTDEDTVRRFHKAVGVGHVAGPLAKPGKYFREHHKPFWSWYVSAYEPFQHVLDCVWNGLGERRKQRAMEVLQEVKNTRRRVTMLQKSHPVKLKTTFCDGSEDYLNLAEITNINN